MKKVYSISVLSLFFLLTACGGGNELAEKKELLKEKQMALEKLSAEIKVLEKEIATLDPNFLKEKSNLTLVTVIPLKTATFTGFLEVQGTVESDNNVILTAETSGIVRTIAISEGQAVGQGQLLVVQDSEILQKTIAEIKTALELADITFKRQESLWNQKIGTEIQYLQAKNNKERFERQLQTLNAQIAMANVIAPFGGIVDEIYIKKGQMASPGSQILKLVNSAQVNVVAEVSETYLGKIKRGDKVTVFFPSLNLEREAIVALIGQTINAENRTFRVEVKLSNPENILKPDLLATLRLKDYEKAEAITVPTNLIQNDKAGEFVFIAIKEGKKTIAKKLRIKRGDTYKNKTLILEGLKGNEELIEDGYREVTEGLEVKIVNQKDGKIALKEQQ